MSILIGGFTKGWQNKADTRLMLGEALFRVVDLSFAVSGVLTCRDLHRVYTPLSSMATTHEIKDLYVVGVEGKGLYRVYCTANETLYRWDSATSTLTALQVGCGEDPFTYAATVPALSERTHVYVSNGTIMGVDDGQSFMTWGIDPPENTVTPTISTVTGNLSAGAYRYVYTFYDTFTGAESEPSNACAGITVTANAALEITNIRRSNNSRVNARRLYRTVANGGNYYLVATITDNVVTGFYDSLADTSLTSKAEFSRRVPPTASIIIEHDEYVMLSGDLNFKNRLWFSEKTYPDSVPTTYYIPVGAAENEVIGLKRFEEKLYGFSYTNISGLDGSTPTTFVMRESRAHTGPYAARTIAVGPDGIYFLAYDGVFKWDAAQAKKVSTPIDRLFGKAPATWVDIVDTTRAASEAVGTCWNGKYYLSVPLKSLAGTTSKKLLVYDIYDDIWNMYDVECDDLFTDVRNGWLLGSVNLGDGEKVYRLFDTQRSTVDVPNPEFVTKAYDITDAGEYTRSRREIDRFQQTGGQNLGFLREFRIDAVGDWTFTFYVDGKQKFEQSFTGLGESDSYKWYGFTPNIKGRTVVVKGVANGTPTPTTCSFKEMEIR